MCFGIMQVSLKGEDFTAQGIYNYSVSYYYETICNDEDNDIIPPAPTFCSGWINLSLIIVVTGEYDLCHVCSTSHRK